MSVAIIGAYGTNFHTGAAYVFTESQGTWSEQSVLASPEEQASFGLTSSGFIPLDGTDDV